MNVKQAKEYVELGVAQGFRAYRAPMGKGWLLVVDVRRGGGLDGDVLETALGVPREFASLDTLYNQVQQLGVQVEELAFSTR